MTPLHDASAPARGSRPAVGQRAPDVTLEGPDGPVPVRSLYADKVLVLYFYPKDETLGCTLEACTFRDRYEDFLAAGADVVGVSTDDADAHARFADRHRLPFRLLSDPTGAAKRAYGVTRTALGLLDGRVTFVIDRQGIVRCAFSSVTNMRAHVDEALETVRRLASVA